MAEAQTKKRMRSCIGCGAQAGKKDLLRIVRNAQGEVNFDVTGRAPGRGAYVCSLECLELADKKNKLGRALKVTLTKGDYERVAAQVAAQVSGTARQ